MRKNPVKETLQRGEIAWGTWITSGNIHVTRTLLNLGLDWLTVDMEHSPVDWSTVATLVGVIADAGAAPFVRVPEGTPFHIKRALDLGAFGLVIPTVETPEQAAQIVDAGRYPPEGRRSAGGGLHHLHFAASLEEYLAQANREIMLVLQIESPLGVANCRAIAATRGCDALFVGPLDLETRIKATVPGNRVGQEFEKAVREVISAGWLSGRVTGIHARTAEEARYWAGQGMRLLAVGTDIALLAQGAIRCFDALRAEARKG